MLVKVPLASDLEKLDACCSGEHWSTRANDSSEEMLEVMSSEINDLGKQNEKHLQCFLS